MHVRCGGIEVRQRILGVGEAFSPSHFGCFTPLQKVEPLLRDFRFFRAAWFGSYRCYGSTSVHPPGGQDQPTLRNVPEQRRPRGTSVS
jgi:hypothetical protein